MATRIRRLPEIAQLKLAVIGNTKVMSNAVGGSQCPVIGSCWFTPETQL